MAKTTDASAKPARKSRGGFGSGYASLPLPAKIVGVTLLLVLVYALPLLRPPILTTNSIDFGSVMFRVVAFALVALGLNIVIGYAGLLDLGYVGFYAIGAYTTGVVMAQHATWPWLAAMVLSVVVTMVAGVLLGWPTLRVRGDYLAIVTLGFGEIVRLTLINSEWLGGSRGISDIPRPPSLPLFEIPHLSWDTGVPLVDLGNTTTFLQFGVIDQVPYYWLALTIVLVVLLADILIKSSRVGRSWEATREDEDVAEMMGVPTFRFKLLAFATGAFVGGLAGALFASRQGFINPQSFPLLLSILFVAAVVIGGQGNRWGVIIGAALVAYLPERFRAFEDWRLLVFGVALVLLAIYRPQGLLPPGRTRRAKKMEKQIDELEEGDEPPPDVETETAGRAHG
jgi:branched-chain amino acid transport system permease protein